MAKPDHFKVKQGSIKSNKKHFTTYTYGCQMNENDTERLAGQLMEIGYEYTEEPEKADLILINTCCVRESAEKKIYGKIGELKKLKAIKPNLIIGVAGCMAQKDRDKIFKKASHIDFVIGTHNIHKLAELVQKVEKNSKPVLEIWDQAVAASPEMPAIHKGQVSAWVPITYGCNNFCTYCIVPYVRGRERSRPLADIVNEIQQLGQDGFQEITLLGQNVNSYGRDSSEPYDFADLLQAVDEVDTITRVRYLTSHPRDMNDKVISAIQGGRKICEHFHLPIQSGSNTILKLMNRGYTADYYRQLVAKIRQAIPHASITTDLIVGFPGETDELFQETLQFIQSIRFDAAYTFLYSKRSGTPAAAMPNQVPLTRKKERLQQLMKLQNDISLEINQTLEGRTVEVLVEGTSKNDANILMGRTRTNKIVLWKENGSETIGRLLPIHIRAGQTWLLKGEFTG
ncbi:MAG: tRNA (N6-isopentenyl adenosine(37)-C2)-methylthiotransferase MiaB [Veillonellales bacterium]